jgi:hypothetical protein
MEFDFLKPIDDEIQEFINGLTSQQLGSKIVLHTKEQFPDLNKIKIAVIGVLENRGDKKAVSDVDLVPLRKELYGLFPGNWDASIADLGDIAAGNSVMDTYFAVKKVVASLIKKKITPIVIGGSQDITYALYRAYDDLEQMVNLVSIDNKFDFGKEDEAVSASSYLTKIIIDEPNNLFNYCNIGYQTYFNSQEEIDLIEKLFFDGYRLGEVSNNIAISEPVFRDADLVSIDLNSIKSSDSGNFVAFHYRSNEYPFGSKENYLKYIVPLEEEELIFYKSDKTDRWWIEIPFISNVNNKLKRNSLLPCSYNEYLQACNQELPERWWKAQRKNIY